jgi:hypothetical protein
MKSTWIKLHRKSLHSDIWEMPPLYFRVWAWLLMQANHAVGRWPTAQLGTIIVGKGQVLTSINKIAEGVRWKERHVVRKPNKKTISVILRWLERHGMIIIEKSYWIENPISPTSPQHCPKSNGLFTLITIVNWDRYQEQEKPKVTPKVTVAGHKQEERRRKGISCANLKTLKAFLAPLPEFENLPQNTQTLLGAFLDGARQSNKTKTITSGRLTTLLGSILAVVNETSTTDLDYALKRTIQKAANDGFDYKKRNPVNYVRAIAKSEYGKRQAEQQKKYEPPSPDWDKLC